jgi:putative PIN family toxin of toxin-antitoxin system
MENWFHRFTSGWLIVYIACNIMEYRLVLDTSVLVAAIRSHLGASAALLQLALQKKITMLATVPLVLEYEAVLMRAEHLAASGLEPEEVAILLDALVAVSEPVKLAFLWRPQLRDSDDDMVLEAAVNGHADAIVTLNSRDFAAVAPRFGIAIWTPKEALKKVRKP